MDEEKVRKRCIELTAGWLLDQGLVGLVHSVYRAAYADGLEKAAKVGEGVADLLYSSSPSHKKGCMTMVETIRQHAKEMGHE